MGLQLCTPVGSVIMYKFLIASRLAVATLASPNADAEAGVPAWPSIRGYGLQSTCYGCRPYPFVHAIGKRSAEAEPYLGYGYSRLGYGHRLRYYGHGLGYYGRGYGYGHGYRYGYLG